MSESNDLFEKPQVEMIVEEKPKKKKKNFTPEQKAAFVERMRKAREAKLLKKAKELNEKQSQSNPPPSDVSTTEVVKDKPKKTRKPRQKKETVVNVPQSHQYDYSYINNLNQSINNLNNNLLNLARSQSQQSQPKPKPQVVEKEKEIKKEPLKEEPKQPPKMAEIHQKSTQQSSPINQKRKIWNATRRAFVYI